MRHIEFRAWLPHARKTVWSDYGTVKQREPDARRRGRMVEFDPLYFSISHDSLEHPQIFTDTPEHFYGEDIDEAARDAVLLQHTGLQDKNGVGIYEGDIIAYGPHPNPDRWEVKWVGSGLVGWQGENDWFLLDARMTQIEVIGNIYETPELLADVTDVT